jgi:3-oxoacyl-[acyl-carrier-protein] synthase-1
MSNITILDFDYICSLGNKEQTVDAIKKSNIKIKTKKLDILEQDIDIPFYGFENHIEQNQDQIYFAIKNIVSKVIRSIPQENLNTTALIIGTSIIDWYLVDAINSSAYEYKKRLYESYKYSIDTYSKKISKEFGLNSFTLTINTACTSSANAILEAKNLLEVDIFTNVIVVGLEIFSQVMSSGFYSMELISKTAIKPFDNNRDGLILGEAICAMVLGKSKSLYTIEGGFSNCNSQTITSVSSSGQECIEVMQNALKNCKLNPSDITLLKAHATGSFSNDEAEINAISEVFDPSLIFTAIKPYIGHTIGASGILEISIILSCIENQFIPKTLNCNDAINKSYKPIDQHINCNSGIFMFNYFGFGGNNTSIVIKKAQQ